MLICSLVSHGFYYVCIPVSTRLVALGYLVSNLSLQTPQSWQRGWDIQVSAYQYDSMYQSSKQNANADIFSRLWCGTSTEDSPSEELKRLRK